MTRIPRVPWLLWAALWATQYTPLVASAADWQPLAVDWPTGSGPDHRMHVGGGDPNPTVLLPLAEVRGRWLRFSATETDADSGIGLGINLYRGASLETRSAPSRCEAAADARRCTTLLWVPPDAARVVGVVWATRRAGDVLAPVVEVATAAGTGDAPAVRMHDVVALVRSRYYRSGEVDWPEVERALASIPSPPDDADPVAPLAQWLRDRLPANKHTFVALAERMQGNPAAAPTLPGCETPADETAPAVVTMPGIGAIAGDEPRRYAGALHDCLMRSGASRPWVIDMRDNGGGNMYPMITGLAPLLHEGPLYAFVDGRGRPAAQVGIGKNGLTSNQRLAFAATSDVGTRAVAPVIVLYGPRCASSCEQTANALASRPRTLFVGMATAGYTTANAPHAIDAHYTLVLTESYTADPCGRAIDDHLEPDIVVDRVDDRSIDDLLRVDAVARWLEETRSKTGTPVSSEERDLRCGNHPVASH